MTPAPPPRDLPRMPAVFLGHGSPMNTLERNRYTDAWRALGASLPRPRAVLAISAHWYTTVTAVTAMARPPTIHDFYGFPPALSEFEYPAPGDARLAERVAEIAKPDHVGLDHDGWGLDHGTWSVLAHVLPRADVPVVQLSLNGRRDADFHLARAARLAPLRDEGVLILASGNVVHNLRAMQWSEPELAFDWARRFDDAAREVITTRTFDAGRLVEHPDFAAAAPTPEHFLPFLYLAGLGLAGGEPVRSLVEGCAFGSISMASYATGAARPVGGAHKGSASLPDPRDIPAEDTNT